MTVDERASYPSGDGGSADRIVRLEWTDYEDPSRGIVAATAEAAGRHPTDLPPLHDAIETDALNELLHDDAGGRTPTRVAFHYAGRDVSVSGDGLVVVRPEAT